MVDDITNRLILKFTCVATVLIMTMASFSMVVGTEKVDGLFVFGNEGTSRSSSEQFEQVFDPTMAACYSNYDHVEVGTSNVHASTAIGVWNGLWTDHFNGRWQYYFKIAGMAYSEGDDLIRVALVTVKEAEGSEHFVLDSVDHSDYIWGYPNSSSTSNNASELSNLVIGVALGLLNNAASTVWTTVSSVISILRNGCNNVDEPVNNHKSFSWSWSPDINKTVQHVTVYTLLEHNTTAKFTTEYAVIGPVYEVLTTGTFTFTMTSPNTNGVSPANMTLQEREQNGIQTIPRNQLQTAASSLGISDTEIEMMMSTEQDEFYFTSSAPTCTITSDPDLNNFSLTDANSLHQAISAQIDRSELLVNSLSDEPICDMDGSAEIIDKHTKRLINLAAIEQRLEEGIISQNEMNVLIGSYEKIMADDTSTGLVNESDIAGQWNELHSASSFVEVEAVATRDPNMIHRGEKHEVIGYV